MCVSALSTHTVPVFSAVTADLQRKMALKRQQSHGELTMMAVREQKGRYSFRSAHIQLPVFPAHAQSALVVTAKPLSFQSGKREADL